MKFQILQEFRQSIQDQDLKLSENTKKKYYQAVKSLFKDLDFTTLSQITSIEVEERLKKLKTKNDVSAAVNGLLMLQKFDSSIQLPKNLMEISQKKRNYKKRSFDPIKLDTIRRKIRNIADPAIRNAYELMLSTGLRVSEVAGITRADLKLDDADNLFIYIKHFKGGRSDYVVVEDSKLKKKLIEHAQSKKSEERLFYTAGHLQNIATQYHLECHDFRRAFAKINYANSKKKLGSYRAKEETRQAMHHQDMRTTKRYLKREIDIK